MNNKGQTLALFVVLIPVFLFIFCYVFDAGMIMIENKKIENLSISANKYLKEGKDIDTIKEIIKNNDNEIEVTIKFNEIKLKKELKSTFGKIVGYESYTIKS